MYQSPRGAIVNRMAEQDPKRDARKGDRHKRKTINYRPHPKLRRQLEALADRNANTLTTELNAAVREWLKVNGLWPPPAETADPHSNGEA